MVFAFPIAWESYRLQLFQTWRLSLMHAGFLHVFSQLDGSFLLTVASSFILAFKHLFHHQGSTWSPQLLWLSREEHSPTDAWEAMTSWNKGTALDSWSGGRSPPWARITSSSSWPACRQAPNPMFPLFSLHSVSRAGNLTTWLRCTCQQDDRVEFPMGDSQRD